MRPMAVIEVNISLISDGNYDFERINSMSGSGSAAQRASR